MSDWVYEALVVRVIDADTIVVDLDMGMRVWQRNVRVRLAGLDAPELSTPEGKAARDAVRELAPAGTRVRVVSHSFEKYGRLLGTVSFAGGVCLNDWVTHYLAEGL